MDFLGGWSAQGSDRYARVAVKTISLIQRSVVQALKKPEEDPLGESETLEQYESFLAQQLVTEVEKKRCLNQLDCAHQKFQNVLPTPELLAPLQDHGPEEVLVPDEEDDHLACAPKKRKGNAELRTVTLGSNPRDAREQIRSQLQPGFYICLSGKRKIRTLHRLGSCYLLPGVDYLEYSFYGLSMPSNSLFDCICTLCSRQGVQRGAADSSATASSSSTSSDRE